jgi:protein-S-isoprenylcysteine O-methyltransferase Ste14
MVVSSWQLLSGALLLSCLASFGWAMRKFFVQPAGITTGMRVTKACGIAFAIQHFVAILVTHGITQERGAGGVFLYLSSLGLFWWAIKTTSKRPLSAVASPDMPTHMVEEGPYRFIRHPLYFSYLLTWFAGVIATGRWWLIPSVAVMAVIYFNAASREERKFAGSPLASAYREYQSRTGLFVPNPVKLLSARRFKTSAG